MKNSIPGLERPTDVEEEILELQSKPYGHLSVEQISALASSLHKVDDQVSLMRTGSQNKRRFSWIKQALIGWLIVVILFIQFKLRQKIWIWSKINIKLIWPDQTIFSLFTKKNIKKYKLLYKEYS